MSPHAADGRRMGLVAAPAIPQEGIAELLAADAQAEAAAAAWMSASIARRDCCGSFRVSSGVRVPVWSGQHPCLPASHQICPNTAIIDSSGIHARWSRDRASSRSA